MLLRDGVLLECLHRLQDKVGTPIKALCPVGELGRADMAAQDARDGQELLERLRDASLVGGEVDAGRRLGEL